MRRRDRTGDRGYGHDALGKRPLCRNCYDWTKREHPKVLRQWKSSRNAREGTTNLVDHLRFKHPAVFHEYAETNMLVYNAQNVKEPQSWQ